MASAPTHFSGGAAGAFGLSMTKLEKAQKPWGGGPYLLAPTRQGKGIEVFASPEPYVPCSTCVVIDNIVEMNS